MGRPDACMIILCAVFHHCLYWRGSVSGGTLISSASLGCGRSAWCTACAMVVVAAAVVSACAGAAIGVVVGWGFWGLMFGAGCVVGFCLMDS